MRRFFLQLPGCAPVEIDPEDLWNARGDVKVFAADVAYHLTRKSAIYNGGSVSVLDECGQVAAYVPIMPYEHEMVSRRGPAPLSAALH
jgi:hypothetical protein